ncbi:hypothetical protein RclHR1_26170001 [Rhizophagus clarus]|uniref:Uncharacterized protein n=1 Tax=Rhizophagus clarus TaxID=94130 RepID=A0A2Z6RCW5_9GLOM|nr:hypothetical protein RclHR1_26170001 [Rhizophagus clarus]
MDFKEPRTRFDFGLDDLENTDYNNDNNENTFFEALWNDSDNADNIDEVEYKFYTDTNGRCRWIYGKPIGSRIENPFFAMQEVIKRVHELLHKECEIIKLQESLEKT